MRTGKESWPWLSFLVLVGGVTPLAAQNMPWFEAAAGSGYPGTMGQLHAQVIADIDRDGKPDLIFGMVQYPPMSMTALSVARNLGNGAFTTGTVAGPATELTINLAAAADVDGDGWVDVFLARRSGFSQGSPQPALLYRNQGGTLVLAPGAVPAVAMTAHSAVFLDVEVDGDPDLFLIDVDVWGVLNLRLWINDGTGTFAEQNHRLPAWVGRAHQASVLDLDRDGDPDLFINSPNGMTFLPYRMLINDGTGVFTLGDPGNWPGTTSRVLVGDLDGDGWQDVVMGPGPYWRNVQGTLQPWGGVSYSPPALGLLHNLVDFDGDGALDMIAERIYGSPRLVLLQNQGSVFVDIGGLNVPGVPIAMDFDLDGDQDLLCGSSFLQGTVRHAASRNEPVRGQAWHPGFTAQANHVLFVGLGIGRGSSFVPGHGWLWLDPALSMWIGNLVFATRSEQIVPLTVPNVPQIVGIEVCVQALDLDLGNSRRQTTNAACATIR